MDSSREHRFVFESARSLLERESGKLSALTSGCCRLDFLLELVGVAGCGKSQLCMQLTVHAIINGKKVICIETERGFSLKRIQQLFDVLIPERPAAELMKNLLISMPNSLEELIVSLSQLILDEQKMKETSVLIVDSIATFFRGEDAMSYRSNLEKVGAVLCKIATQHSMAVILTNHVTSSPNSITGHWETRPCLGNSWSHRTTVRVWMERNEKTKKRKIILIKSPLAPERSAEYEITETGVVIKDDDSREF